MAHYLRCLSFVERFRDCEVLFLSSTRYDHFVTKAGYNTFDCETFEADRVMSMAAKFDFSWLNLRDLERVFLAQAEVIRLLKPDLVIGDAMPTLKMAAELTGVPFGSLMNAYMTKYYAETRALSRTHRAYNLLKTLPAGLAEKITAFAEKMAFRSVHRPFRRLRSRHGLRSLHTYPDEMEGDENWLCDDPALFPQRDLPAHYEFIGPLLYRSAEGEAPISEPLDFSKPTICICMGSSGDASPLRFLTSGSYSDFQFIVAGSAGSFTPAPHIYQKDFINLGQVLPFCSLLICHGGNGTIYSALKHKVPMLCLTSNFEQEWNVQMLEKFGYGKSIHGDPKGEIDRALQVLQKNSAALSA